jgi:N-acetylmuramoyl-L-alanine amidase
MPKQYTVQQGDCISSIAAQFGLRFDTVWNDGGNARLKQLRPDPNVLYPGDVVVIPDLSDRSEDRSSDNQHQFKKKDERTHIKIRLLLDDEPRAGLDYELQIAGQTINGTTDGAGCLNEVIPPHATDGVLIVGSGTTREIIKLGLGTLDPIDTEEGVRKRLDALGYDVQDLEAACRAFRSKESMDPGGGIDDDLRSKLKEKFGQ